MNAEQKQNMVLALRELADRIEAQPGHLVGRDVEFQASLSTDALGTQKVSLSLWFIKAAKLARAGELLFP